MALSKASIDAISDLIENRLSMMTVNDQDDLRDKLTLQRALCELHLYHDASDGVVSAFNEIPRRGRRRKVGMLHGEDMHDAHRG